MNSTEKSKCHNQNEAHDTHTHTFEYVDTSRYIVCLHESILYIAEYIQCFSNSNNNHRRSIVKDIFVAT